MVFQSHLFLLVFFPLVPTGYFLLGRLGKPRGRWLWLLCACLVFYGWSAPIALLFLLCEGGGSYALGRAMLHSPAHKKSLAAMGAVALVGVLFCYKYTGFFLSVFRPNAAAALSWAVPLGLSFLTFQQLLFLRECYSGAITSVAPLDYALFLSFFPTVSSGPITRYGEISGQLSAPFSWDNFGCGLYCFSLGLAKKVLVADTLAGAVRYGYGNLAALGGTDAALTILCYTLQLYFDFSGYCDMAAGLAKMLGIDLPVNFDSPYRAVSVSAFWGRWHITLSRFFRLCVYIPMGGNRKGLPRTCLNIMVIYLLSGLWHGAGWGFLLWGALHGAAMVAERIFRSKLKLPKILGWALTFLFLNVAWVYFRAPSIGDANALLSTLFSGNWALPSAGLSAALLWPELAGALTFFGKTLPGPAAALTYWLPLCAAPIAFLLLWCKNPVAQIKDFRPTPWKTILCVLALCWSAVSLSGVSQFLYVNF